MGVFGVGIDLIRTERIKKSVDRWGDRFKKRVFTPFELAFCSGKAAFDLCLATRFAAKEAFAKALGRGIRVPVFWTDIEIRNDLSGKPEIVLSERAELYCRELGVKSWHVSLTDEGDYGAAVVVLER